MVRPRLLLSSPVKGCGKSTLLDVCERLVARAKKSDNISAAALYHFPSGVPP
jgi:ABC-type nitrate/sulfonate/bicarbonate transport system ATPase subunit